jgi:pimeloyl-ACP methyl ester carboxylesterase
MAIRLIGFHRFSRWHHGLSVVSMTPQHAHDERLVHANGIELCIQSFGDPAAPALLLIGGAEASMDWWDDEFCERLAAGRRYVIRYDSRDTGRSTTFAPGNPPYGADALLSDASDLLDELHIPAAHIVGISMGGGIAQELAISRPERVASLTLISTSPGGPDLPSMSDELTRQFAESDGGTPDWSDRDAVIAYYLGGEYMLAGTIPVDEERLRRVAGRAWDRSPSPASAQNHWRLTGGWSTRDRLNEITAPTLVLHGTADPLFPYGHGEVLAREIPGARLVPLAGMGHQMPPPESWDAAVAEILSISGGDRS